MSARRYRQKGYMDDDRPERPAPRAPRPEREGPRGRGLGAPTADVVRCAACGRRVSPPGAADFVAACSHCHADLHTCTNCRHFDPSARFECRLEIAERVVGKSDGNECRQFEAKVSKEFGSESGRPADPRAAFDALFKT